MTILEIRNLTALNRAEFARKYNIPYRTVQDWEAEKRECPLYVAELLEKVVRIDLEGNKMSKYQVEFLTATKGMIEGTEPRSDIYDDCIGDNITAETPEQAIEFATDYIVEHSTGRAEATNNEITYFDENGNAIEQLYNFKATEIEE